MEQLDDDISFWMWQPLMNNVWVHVVSQHIFQKIFVESGGGGGEGGGQHVVSQHIFQNIFVESGGGEDDGQQVCK